MPNVLVDPNVLSEEGYSEIVECFDDGEVILRNEDGGLEVFVVRDSYSGWSIPTACGRVLEFCRSLPEGRL